MQEMIEVSFSQTLFYKSYSYNLIFILIRGNFLMYLYGSTEGRLAWETPLRFLSPPPPSRGALQCGAARCLDGAL